MSSAITQKQTKSQIIAAVAEESNLSKKEVALAAARPDNYSRNLKFERNPIKFQPCSPTFP